MSRRLRLTENILEMMHNPEQIRNIGLIGHIDHGKTTLSDSLLAEAGLLSKSLAGEARVLDYLEEEQRRGITMKSANISLRYDHSLKGSKPFLINLVDTPGHLDFSGKVTRALRLADGVIVIVDSVEEVSSQTETVVRQALEEAVRPILFINKIDRLFNELKLDLNEIKTKFARIITDFNQLIEMYGNSSFSSQWKVSAERGSVIFGSALHKWGFVIPQLNRDGRNFDYFYNQYQNDRHPPIAKTYPVWECVLAAVVEFLPNPLVAQKYRIDTIWSGEADSPLGKAIKKCDPKGPLVVFLSRVQKINNRLIGTGRIFSGTLKRGERIFLVNANEKSNINQLNLFMGARMESIDELLAGNIAAIGGLKAMKSGETIFDTNHIDDAKPFENVKYVSEPVVTVAVEPDMLKNLTQLHSILEEIQIEDPNISVSISEDSGEVLLSGMGPLHLEIVTNMIKERGVKVEVSDPSSVFRESVAQASDYHEAYSPNEKNQVSLKIERLDHKSVEFIRSAKSNVLFNEYLRAETFPSHTEFDEYEARGIWNVDRFQNVIVSRLEADTGIQYDENDQPIQKSQKPQKKKKSPKKQDSGSSEEGINLENKQELIKILNGICLHGILAQEPLSELKIVIKSIKIASDAEVSNYFELSTMIRTAFIAALEDAKPTLMEPIYKVTITSPEEYIGAVTSLVSQFSGKILKISQDAFRAKIDVKMSVRGSIQFAQEIRGKTAGRVFWQNLFDKYSPVPEYEQGSIIQDIKFRKGLAFF